MKKIHVWMILTTAVGCSTADEIDTDDAASDAADEAASLAGFTGQTYEVAKLPTVLMPGDIVRHGSIAVLVPPLGGAVTAEALSTDGQADTLDVTVELDGNVKVSTGEPTPASVATAEALAAGPCTDQRYALAGYRWIHALEWSFKASSTPHGGGAETLPVDFAEAQIRAGGANIVTAHNNCGRADHVGATIKYLGRTTRGVNVTRNFTCGNQDGHSVVAFGDFDDNHPNLLAATCTWSLAAHGAIRTAVESDVRISRYDHLWWQNQPCNELRGDQFVSLEAVMTHERGHSFGLGHVNAPSLTMNPTMTVCTKRASTLGLGDMLGLEKLY